MLLQRQLSLWEFKLLKHESCEMICPKIKIKKMFGIGKNYNIVCYSEWQLIISHLRQPWEMEWILGISQSIEVFHRPISHNRFSVSWELGKGIRGLTFFFLSSFPSCDIQVYYVEQLRRKEQMGMPGYPAQQKSRRL